MEATPDMRPRLDVSPVPTDEEAAVIAAVAEALWPRPVVAVAAEAPRPSQWRFSGRWWTRRVSARRERPY